MVKGKEELICEIEEARKRLNEMIDRKDAYGLIYQCSVELDHLLNQYLAAGY